MEVWLRGLIENMIDALFEEGFLLSIKRQADFFAVEGADKQNLYLGYANGYISGYAHAAIVLLCRREPTDEEQDEIRMIISRRSEEILKKLGII
jgi:hypothetical protein